MGFLIGGVLLDIFISPIFASVVDVLTFAVLGGIAFLAHRLNVNNAKARSLYGVIEILTLNEKFNFREAMQVFVKMKKKKTTIQQIMKKNNDDRNKILFLLNYFEFIASGIEKKLIDKEIYKDLLGKNFYEFYFLCESYIKERQEYNPRAFINFEEIAKKWKRELGQ